MDDGDLAEQISRLEDEIERFSKTIEWCRKIILLSKAAIPIGAILLVAMLLGAVSFDPIGMIVSVAAVIGGIVLFGSNRSTLQQTMAAMQEAEMHRRELIGRINLRVVGNGAWKRKNGGHELE
jgi:hypothetical protein